MSTYIVKITNRRNPPSLWGGLPAFSSQDRFASVEEAAKAIYDRAYEIIDSEVVNSAEYFDYDPGCTSEEEREELYTKKHDELMTHVLDEITRYAGWWHDGVQYSIIEDGAYYVAEIKNYYVEPTAPRGVKFDAAAPLDYADAVAEKERLTHARYVTGNGEAGRPSYCVVSQAVADWLAFDDPSKYDWESYDGDADDEQAKAAWMAEQDEDYVRAHMED